MGTLIVVAVLLIVVCAILKLLVEGKSTSQRDGNYEAQVILLTPAEQAFYRSLQKAIGGAFTIFPKVRLADIIRPKSLNGRRGYYAAFNRIAGKHVDFVCVHPATMKVLGVIELDDRTHAQENRKSRDHFVDSALTGAAIPICHVQVKREYETRALHAQITTAFKFSTTAIDYYRKSN
ncbi:MAG: hypothetical protein B9S32_08830 [Verrucomicrobia bacterium Tous-C9LFEB]|nr:MAG: hypothetical protein B9S32_08830 [Verrucomicrobia bacterium Tous-C9LFEB]